MEQKVQYLTHLDIQIFESRLLLIKAEGFSENEQPGVPKLMPSLKGNKDEELKEDILELDFINQQVEDSKKNKITFQINIVIDLRKLSGNIKGVKVVAEENADIVLI